MATQRTARPPQGLVVYVESPWPLPAADPEQEAAALTEAARQYQEAQAARGIVVTAIDAVRAAQAGRPPGK